MDRDKGPRCVGGSVDSGERGGWIILQSVQATKVLQQTVVHLENKSQLTDLRHLKQLN